MKTLLLFVIASCLAGCSTVNIHHVSKEGVITDINATSLMTDKKIGDFTASDGNGGEIHLHNATSQQAETGKALMALGQSLLSAAK